MNRNALAATLAVCGSVLAVLAIALVAMVIRSASRAIIAFASVGQPPEVASAIIGEALIQIVVVSVYAIPALALLSVALTVSRYRASWFLWFVRLSSAPLFFLFPLGSIFAIFALVYSSRHRHEFGHSPRLPTVA